MVRLQICMPIALSSVTLRDDLDDKFLEHSGVTWKFVSLQFHFEQEKAVFHIQNKQVFNDLRSISKQIPMPSGMKVQSL